MSKKSSNFAARNVFPMKREEWPPPRKAKNGQRNGS